MYTKYRPQQYCDMCGKSLQHGNNIIGTECLCNTCHSKILKRASHEQIFFQEIAYFKQNRKNKINVVV